MAYQIRWFDGMGAKPDYSKATYETAEAARLAADEANCYGELAYQIVDASTHREVK